MASHLVDEQSMSLMLENEIGAREDVAAVTGFHFALSRVSMWGYLISARYKDRVASVRCQAEDLTLDQKQFFNRFLLPILNQLSPQRQESQNIEAQTLNTKIPLPVYPDFRQAKEDGLMTFRRGYFTFNIARADNGLIFSEYDIDTDTERRKIATTPEQMQKIFNEWFVERSGEMLAFARKIMTEEDA